jgi:hypothetical protein
LSYIARSCPKNKQKESKPNSFQDVQETKRQTERHHGVAFNKIQTVRNSTGVIQIKPKNLIRKFFTFCEEYRAELSTLLSQYFTRKKPPKSRTIIS